MPGYYEPGIFIFKLLIEIDLLEKLIKCIGFPVNLYA